MLVPSVEMHTFKKKVGHAAPAVSDAQCVMITHFVMNVLQKATLSRMETIDANAKTPTC